MTEDRLNEFTKRLDALAAEFEVVNGAFCGTALDGEGTSFIGTFVGKDTLGASDLMNHAMNVGRLWQYAREQVRHYLNRFERDVWSRPKGGR